MITFRQFELVYEGQVCQLDEGAISNLKNFMSKLFGGKVDQLDKIVYKMRESDASYWKEWSDNSNKYTGAQLLYSQTSDPIERSKQGEIMNRTKKAMDVLVNSRNEIKKSLDTEASIICGTNDRLKDYYSMEKCKAEVLIAQDSYEAAKKMADDHVLDVAYDQLTDALNKVKDGDKIYTDKYGKDYKNNLFGLTNADLAGTHQDYITHDNNFDAIMGLHDHNFIESIKKMPPEELSSIDNSMQDLLSSKKHERDLVQKQSEDRLQDLKQKNDIAGLKKESDMVHHQLRDINDYIKMLMRRISIVMTISTKQQKHTSI